MTLEQINAILAAERDYEAALQAIVDMVRPAKPTPEWNERARAAMVVHDKAREVRDHLIEGELTALCDLAKRGLDRDGAVVAFRPTLVGA